jgi:DNA-binding IclR family transcriptional regulator
VPLTRHSVTSAGLLRMPTIRARRWSQEHEERVEGRESVAVPITLWDSERVIAGLSITVGVTRRDDPNMLRFLVSAAADISRRLQAVR